MLHSATARISRRPTVRVRARRLSFLGVPARAGVAALASAVAGADRLDRRDGRDRVGALGARRRPRVKLVVGIADRAADGIRSRRACGAGRCRGATGASSASWSPTTRNRRAALLRSLDRQSSAASATINGGRSRRAAADAGHSGPAVFAAAAIAAGRASSACFRNRERRDERCDHRLRLRQSALGRERRSSAPRASMGTIRKRSW
jgi:hypothetical protein